MALPARNPLVLATEDLHAGKGKFHALVRLSTGHIRQVSGGLPISPEHEDVELLFEDNYPTQPPAVAVRHDRFVGYPHVLGGCILCIYLDVDREWHPGMGVDAVVDRLLEWFEDSAADRFDSRTALYHPIGGVPPSPHVGGVLVVRRSRPDDPPPISTATVNVRALHRVDLIRWDGPVQGDDPATATDALVVRTADPMPRGLVQVDVLGEALARVAHANGPALAEAARAAVVLIPHVTDDWFRVIVDVAHPNDPTLSYVACAITPTPNSSTPSPGDLLSQPIGWTTVHDERPAVATRRDHRRPTAAFHGKCVELWGCGGIGSWMAEFIARAGAKHVTLRDPRGVSSGLLVRQNYREDDVGLAKAAQLAERLRAIRDDLDVVAETSSTLDLLNDGYTPAADILVDATINVTVAARLDEWARATAQPPLMAQVATDPRTATLGMLVVADGDAHIGPATVDDATWEAIRDEAALERFHGFWTPLDKTDQLVPALGCSTPTFHGSAADLASLAGSLVSLLGEHVTVGASGTHLVQSSHAQGPTATGHHFVPYRSR